MGKGKKGRRKSRAPRVPAERVEALLANLDEIEPSDVTDAELAALIEASSRDEPDVARQTVPKLHALADGNKKRLKALRRGLHRLRQRGIEVDDLEVAQSSGGIRIAPDHGAGGGLPVLMAPVEINAVRRMTFGLARGPGVVLVETVFKARELFRLVASPSNRVAFRRWAKQMCRADGDGLPERVALTPAWLNRKLWEIGHYAAADKLGPEVDKNLLEYLQWPARAPAHPAGELALGDGEPLAFESLASDPRRLDAFYHGSGLAALRQQWYELGGDTHIEPGSDATAERRDDMKGPVRDWADQWGSAAIAETLLDLALFYDQVGDAGAAHTFADLGVRRDGEQSTAHDNRIHAFLLEVVLWQLQR